MVLFSVPPGVFLCVAITYTNLAVMKALCMKDSPLNKHNMLLRRTSNGMSLACNAATREERSFGWLMFFLCVAFVVCWLPQLVTYRYDISNIQHGLMVGRLHALFDGQNYISLVGLRCYHVYSVESKKDRKLTAGLFVK